MNTPTLPQSQVFEAADSPWGGSLQPAGCPACQRVYLVEAIRMEQTCPGCVKGKLQAQPALLRPEAPELLAPFRYPLSSLRPALEKFVNEVWLRSEDFDTDKLLQRAAPVYWPMWLVDGDIAGHWQAETGFDYQVKSSQESYGDQGWKTREVVETRIRWEPRAGQIRRHYDNLVTPALREQKRLLKLAGNYQREQAMAYQPEQVRERFCAPPTCLLKTPGRWHRFNWTKPPPQNVSRPPGRSTSAILACAPITNPCTGRNCSCRST
ncbi:MAG: hypothetical protein L6461_07280 [Anaerolineae bacterium]|nr:hypothetical protein [Anaerolineae bacterium]